MTTRRIDATVQELKVRGVRRVAGLGFLFLGAALALVTRVALAQTDVPDDPATQAVWAYLTAHGVGQPAPETVPDAATQGVLGYLRAHGLGQATVGQTADANTLGVLGYLAAHDSSPSSVAVSAPEAATLGILGYLRAHGLGSEPMALGASDVPYQGLTVDWVFVLAATILLGSLIAVVALMQPPTRPTPGGGPARQHR